MRHVIGILVCFFSLCLQPAIKAELISSGEITDFVGKAIDPTALNNATDPFNAAIGYDGVGTISQNGSAGGNGVTITDTDRTRIAHNAGSEGTLNLTGFGVVWGARFTSVGSNGFGELNVLSGARYNSRSTMYIGSGGGSTGVTNVSGIGSILSTGTTLFVGNTGDGTLNVTEGGRASTFLLIGSGTSSVGHTLVSGVKSLVDSPSMTIGSSGIGTLEIRDSATVNTSGFSRIGRYSGSRGAVLVTGADTSWDLGGASLQSVYIGESGIGNLKIARGADVVTDFDVIVGKNLTGVGTLAFAIGDDGTSNTASGLLEVGGEFGVGAGLGFFELAVDNPIDLAVNDVFTLVDYDTYNGELLFVNDGMSISPLTDGGSYTTDNGVVFSIDYDADLDGMGDLGITATVIAKTPEPATLALLILGVVCVAIAQD